MDLWPSMSTIKIKKRSCILIPNEYKDAPFYFLIKNKLTRSSKDFQTNEVTWNDFFFESDKYLSIPRFFPIHEYIPSFELEDISNTGQDIIINHNIIPRNNTQRMAIEYMMTHDSGLIQLPPGEGKTVITINVIASRKKKTFILVHKDYLADQWIGPGKHGKKAGFLDFTDINPKEIVRLTSNNYLDALGCSVIVTTDQTFTSLLRRNRRGFLEALHKANIGIFVADEVHTSIGAPTWAECSMHIPAKVVFGLSATPKRGDGNTDIIVYHMGEVFKLDESGDTMPANITVILMDFEITNGYKIVKGVKKKVNRYEYLHSGGKFQRSRYLNILKNSDVFMNLCKSLLTKFSKKRNMLFIGERVDKLLVPLFEWLDSDDKGMFVSGSTDADLQKNDVFSTPGKIRDGVDVPGKDLLIMTSPISNIDQICGRVTRQKEGKLTPIVIDMVDIGTHRIKETFFPRNDFYSRKGWVVQYLFVDRNGIKKIDDMKAMEILNEEI